MDPNRPRDQLSQIICNPLPHLYLSISEAQNTRLHWDRCKVCVQNSRQPIFKRASMKKLLKACMLFVLFSVKNVGFPFLLGGVKWAHCRALEVQYRSLGMRSALFLLSSCCCLGAHHTHITTYCWLPPSSLHCFTLGHVILKEEAVTS